MKKYRPIKPNFVSQYFGENKLNLYKQWGMLGHNGIDFVCPDKEPIYWDGSIRGTVLNTEIDNNGGLGVNIITEDKDGIFKHRYWHLKEFRCEAGDILESGDLIGLADNTGYSTGTHLHWDIKPMFKTATGAYQTESPSNGYFGCIDPLPYYTGIFIKEHLAQLQGQLSILRQMIEIIKKILALQLEIRVKKESSARSIDEMAEQLKK